MLTAATVHPDIKIIGVNIQCIKHRKLKSAPKKSDFNNIVFKIKKALSMQRLILLFYICNNVAFKFK